jgi:formylglycine-generating enzyme required for sulfatase activity
MLLFLFQIAFSEPKIETFPSGYKMSLIAPGRFLMGSRVAADEQEHEVVLTHSFYIGVYEVDQKLWEMHQKHQSKFKGPDLPVSGITFFDALLFANILSKKEGLEECYRITPQAAEWPKGYKCNGYRLPTEAEWEYATRAEQGDVQEKNIEAYAWTKSNSGKSTHTVGTKKPNAFGLYDTLGNVWEWVWDIYKEYPKTEQIDPVGAKKGQFRIRKGGGYSTGTKRIRIAERYALNPINQHSFLGVRLTRTSFD